MHEKNTSYLIPKARKHMSVWERIASIVDPQVNIMATIKRPKLTFIGHVERHNNLPKTILQCTVEGGRRRGRQRKCWFDNVKEWTKLPMPEQSIAAQDRHTWRNMAADVSIPHPFLATTRSDDSDDEHNVIAQLK
jgi:hypothetical protein